MKIFEYFIPYEAITCDETNPSWLAKKKLSIIFSSFFAKQCSLSDNGIAKQCSLFDNGRRIPSLFPTHAHLHTHTHRQTVYRKLLACFILPICNKVFERIIYYLSLFTTHYYCAFIFFGKKSHIRKSIWF